MISASSMHEAGQPKPVLWDNPEGYRVGRELGRWFRLGAAHVYPWLINADYGKNHHNVVKQLTSN